MAPRLLYQLPPCPLSLSCKDVPRVLFFLPSSVRRRPSPPRAPSCPARILNGPSITLLIQRPTPFFSVSSRSNFPVSLSSFSVSGPAVAYCSDLLPVVPFPFLFWSEPLFSRVPSLVFLEGMEFIFFSSVDGFDPSFLHLPSFPNTLCYFFRPADGTGHLQFCLLYPGFSRRGTSSPAGSEFGLSLPSCTLNWRLFIFRGWLWAGPFCLCSLVPSCLGPTFSFFPAVEQSRSLFFPFQTQPLCPQCRANLVF